MKTAAVINSTRIDENEIQITLSITIEAPKIDDAHRRIFVDIVDASKALKRGSAKDQVIYQIRRSGQKGCTRRDLIRGTGLSSEMIDNLTAEMMVCGELRFCTLRTGGRYRHVYLTPLPKPEAEAVASPSSQD